MQLIQLPGVGAWNILEPPGLLDWLHDICHSPCQCTHPRQGRGTVLHWKQNSSQTLQVLLEIVLTDFYIFYYVLGYLKGIGSFKCSYDN